MLISNLSLDIWSLFLTMWLEDFKNRKPVGDVLQRPATRCWKA